MIFSGDEMICTLSCPNKLFYLPSLIKKRMVLAGPANGTRRPGQWYSKVRPMGHKRTTYEPHPTPPKGKGDKKGITIVIRYTYN